MAVKKLLISLLSLFCVLSCGQAQDDTDFYARLSNAAIGLTKDRVKYDPTYYKIDYPNGDVPADRGVCTDVIIRAYRKLGIDLQKEVHLDMKANFSKYPSKKKWGLNGTDTNIDHRRVPNLQTFFTRKGNVKTITDNPKDYLPGDIVTWDLGRGLVHIGIVIHRKSRDGRRPLIIHNIGRGQVIEDVLYAWKITGHYTYKK